MTNAGQGEQCLPSRVEPTGAGNDANGLIQPVEHVSRWYRRPAPAQAAEVLTEFGEQVGEPAGRIAAKRRLVPAQLHQMETEAKIGHRVSREQFARAWERL